MKKLLIFFCTVAAVQSVQAQQFSAGFRTGASVWGDRHEPKSFDREDYDLSWDKELFVRFETKGKFAFEAGMGHYSIGQRTQVRQESIDGNKHTMLEVRNRSQHVEWNLSAQYEISCPTLQDKCPLLKKIRSYAGVTISPTLSRMTTTTYTSGNSSDITYTGYESSRGDVWSVWTGLSHTLRYEYSPQLYFTSSLRMQVEPGETFNNTTGYHRDSRLGLQIGAGYRFR